MAKRFFGVFFVFVVHVRASHWFAVHRGAAGGDRSEIIARPGLGWAFEAVLGHPRRRPGFHLAVLGGDGEGVGELVVSKKDTFSLPGAHVPVGSAAEALGGELVQYHLREA